MRSAATLLLVLPTGGSSFALSPTALGAATGPLRPDGARRRIDEGAPSFLFAPSVVPPSSLLNDAGSTSVAARRAPSHRRRGDGNGVFPLHRSIDYMREALVVTAASPPCLSRPPPRPGTTAAGPLWALVFNPDGSREDTDDAKYAPGAEAFASLAERPIDSIAGVSGEIKPYDGIASRLSSDRASALVRIAAAFAPPSLGLGPENVQDARIVYMNDSRMDVEAVLLSDMNGGATSLAAATALVSVPFPRRCDSSSKSDWLVEGCVVENVDALDAEASVRIEAASSSSMDSALNRVEYLGGLMRELRSGTILSYPEWWISHRDVDAEMEDECCNIRDLLNGNDGDDFGPEVKAMTQYGLLLAEEADSNADADDPPDASSSPSSSAAVLRAVVGAVGPAGVILKAIIAASGASASSSRGKGRPQGRGKTKSVGGIGTGAVHARVAEAPVPFPEVAQDANGIRAGLDAVMGAAAKAEAEARAEADVETEVVEAAEEARFGGAEAEAEAEVKAARADEEAEARATDRTEAIESGAEAKSKVVGEEEETINANAVADVDTDAKGVAERKRQPKSPEEEAALAERYGSMERLEDRAFAILLDLGMIVLTPDPDDPDYNPSEDGEWAPVQNIVVPAKRP